MLSSFQVSNKTDESPLRKWDAFINWIDISFAGIMKVLTRRHTSVCRSNLILNKCNNCTQLIRGPNHMISKLISFNYLASKGPQYAVVWVFGCEGVVEEIGIFIIVKKLFHFQWKGKSNSNVTRRIYYLN